MKTASKIAIAALSLSLMANNAFAKTVNWGDRSYKISYALLVTGVVTAGAGYIIGKSSGGGDVLVATGNEAVGLTVMTGGGILAVAGGSSLFTFVIADSMKSPDTAKTFAAEHRSLLRHAQAVSNDSSSGILNESFESLSGKFSCASCQNDQEKSVKLAAFVQFTNQIGVELSSKSDDELKSNDLNVLVTDRVAKELGSDLTADNLALAHVLIAGAIVNAKMQVK